MKVIKQGVIPENRLWRGTCVNCASVVEATQGELTNIQNEQRDGDFAWEPCPVCGKGDNKGNGVYFRLYKPTTYHGNFRD